MKMDAKMDPKNDQNRALWRSGVGFLRFWEVLGGVCFLLKFRSAKSQPKIAKIGHKTAKKSSRRDFGVARRNARGRRGGDFRGGGRELCMNCGMSLAYA